MARVAVLFDDLLLGSNVLGMLRAAGHEATLGASAPAPGEADVAVVDLAAASFDGAALGSLGETRTIGVYSHVDVDMRRRAEEAGFDLVVPRSRMAREGAALVESLLTS
jgi:hypothetical protein